MLVGKLKTVWLRLALGPHFLGIFTSQNVAKSFLNPPPLSSTEILLPLSFICFSHSPAIYKLLKHTLRGLHPTAYFG